jgi:hypothetical protein
MLATRYLESNRYPLLNFLLATRYPLLATF